MVSRDEATDNDMKQHDGVIDSWTSAFSIIFPVS